MNTDHGRQLIWLAEVPFDGPPHRQPILARHLCQAFDVTFIEPPPPLRLPRPGAVRRGSVRVCQAAPILNARPAPVRQLLSRPSARRIVGRLAAAQVVRHARNARWRPRQGVVVSSNVYFVDAIKALAPAAVIVDICDDPRYYPGEPSWTHELLVESLHRADIVTTTSRALQAEFVAIVPGKLEYLPNGVHAAILAAPRPATSAGAPVVGFLGHVGPWVDLSLLERVADNVPLVTVEIAGSIDPSMLAGMARLQGRPNVRYVGVVPYAEVPSVLARFTIGTIPFVTSPYTRAVNPIKLYEYAAFDLPIVSTDFSPDVCEFSQFIDVCHTADAFVSAVARHVDHSTLSHTRWIAEAHTWERITAQFISFLDATLQTA